MTAGRRAPDGVQRGPLDIEVDAAMDKVRAGRRVRRGLQPWGRLFVDHAVPFICVYRRPPGTSDALTEGLVTSEASYLLAPGDLALAADVATLVRAVTATLADGFGACLVLEVSQAPDRPGMAAPLFRVVRRKADGPTATIDALETALSRIQLREFTATVEVVTRAAAAPASMPPLLGARGPADSRVVVVGLEVHPIYLDAKRKGGFPLIQRQLRHGLSLAIRQAAFEFTTERTTQRPRHFHALGRRTLVKAVWQIDAELAEISNQFDFLLLTTPRNVDEAWARFRLARFEEAPWFSYPPRPFDPAVVKRRLFRVPLERVEDPTMADLLRQQQDQLDRQITMIADRGSARFRYGGLQLYGTVSRSLLRLAEQLLDRIPAGTRESTKGGHVDRAAFVARAEEELAYLRRFHPSLKARVLVRDDVSGLMVSRGNLLVPAGFTVPASRVEALLQHEIGTHVVTYHNGAVQRFRQLRNGLRGYEELQEGLAVLAEYLVGGLSRSRLRVLAARVVAVRRMISGATFVDVFRELHRTYEFSQRTAFMITMRVFRGGGQPKDAVYLRGLVRLLKYLSAGGALEPLFVGKIALEHLPIMKELEWRQVLMPPPLAPRYLGQPDTNARLERLRAGVRLIDLVSLDTRRVR